MNYRSLLCRSWLMVVLVLASCGDADAPTAAIDAGDEADATRSDAFGADAFASEGGVDAGECADVDGDGHGAIPCGDDCDDSDSSRFPGNAEICDADDEDCNDATYGPDVDLDTFVSTTCCNGAACGNDCDDTLNTVNPGAAEVCNANVDDDCDGLADAADGVCVPCPSGFDGLDRACVDIDECAAGTAACTQIPVATCENTEGSFNCLCPAGYSGDGRGGGGCVDVDECALGTDDCEEIVGTCADRDGSFDCACVTGFTGDGRGAGSCRWSDPSLLMLEVGAGATLSPAFAPGTTLYTLRLPAGAIATTLTPTLAQPTRSGVTVAGVAATSGAAVAVTVGFAPRTISVVVTTETLATRTYTIAIVRTATYVKASNTAANDTFGGAVSMSADGSRLAVAAPDEASSATGIGGNQADNGAAQSGAVYVFARTGTSWAQEAYVKASNTGAGDFFGQSIALSADGTRLAVGAYGESSSATGVGGAQADNGAPYSGAVYVFARTGTTWAQEAYVKASNTGANDYFGNAVSLSTDGSRLAVGAPGEGSSAVGVGGDQASNTAANSGAVYVFARVGASWTQEAYVKASNTAATDAFGTSVALSGDALRLAVGANAEDSSAVGVGGDQTSNAAANSGAVYVFSRAATLWTQEAYVKASNSGADDAFGSAVAMSTDGSRLAIGAPSEDSAATGLGGDQSSNAAANSGAAYVFARTGASWSQEAYVKASNTDAGDAFGSALSLSGDGARLAVGALQEASIATGIDGDQASDAAANAGAVYVFSRTGVAWAQDAYLKATNTASGDALGFAVCLSSDGTRLVTGAIGEDSNALGVGGNPLDNSASNSGATYVY